MELAGCTRVFRSCIPRLLLWHYRAHETRAFYAALNDIYPLILGFRSCFNLDLDTHHTDSNVELDLNLTIVCIHVLFDRSRLSAATIDILIIIFLNMFN
jgi:hypothetical protein